MHDTSGLEKFRKYSDCVNTSQTTVLGYWVFSVTKKSSQPDKNVIEHVTTLGKFVHENPIKEKQTETFCRVDAR